jgi:putative colanic acid biosynthesis UDP-glucose lipid carrier transferase
MTDAQVLARAKRIHASPAKRALDIAFALVAFTLSAPLWPIIALAVVLEDRGAVFFRQERSGFRGTVFFAVKFRSMTMDAERHGARQAVAGDARVTRIGHLLRASALDELPQLWNIRRHERRRPTRAAAGRD